MIMHACVGLVQNPNPKAQNKKIEHKQKTLILAEKHVQNIKEL